MSDLLAALEAALSGGASEAFKEAEASSGSLYDLPPDGEYQALVHLFEFMEYKDNKGIGLKVSYQITNHAIYAGRICGDLMTIASFEPDGQGGTIVNTDRIAWLKGFLVKMEVDVENIDLGIDLRPGSSMLERLIDTPVAIKIKRSEARDGSGRKFENVYLQQKIGDYGAGAAGVPAGDGFTPHKQSDVPGAESFDFGNVGVGARGGAVADDDIPF